MNKQDEYIIECARELIKAINESGRDMKFVHEGQVLMPVNFDVAVYEENTGLVVKNIINHWEVKEDYKE